MKDASKTPENAIEEVKENIDELMVKRYQRWTDTDGRLFVVYGFWYGPNISKLHLGDFEKTDIELLDVHAEKINKMPYERFLLYVIEGMLKPWYDQKNMALQPGKEVF